MRDVNKKILFILWAVVAVFLIVILATRTNAEGSQGRQRNSSEKSININIGSSGTVTIPPAAEDFNKIYTFAGTDFRNIDITLVGGDVILEPADGNEIVVALNGTAWHEENEPVVTLERKTLSVKTPGDVEENKWYQGDRKVTVKIPAACLGTYFNADIETVSSLVYTKGILYESFDVDSISGSITASGTFRNADLNSVSGDITVTGTLKSADCETISGTIDLKTEKPLSDESSFTSVSGDITLTLPEDSSFYMEWQTLSGSVGNEFVGGKCDKKGTLDMLDGKPEIELETISGDIRVIKN